MKADTEIAGRFRVIAQLGAGGMGEVWRALDTKLGREVAIKVLPAALATDPERLRRFAHEARAVAALSHPNILALYDLGEHDWAPYLVTELLEGETLRERIGRGPLPVKESVEIGVQVARGLAAAHAKGIVHRDLKPENMFVTSEGTVKILDFGLASLRGGEESPSRLGKAETETGLTQAGTVLGTAGYMAPEQVRGQRVDHRADIFAFGCVLYEMLAGARAFRGDTSADTMAAILNRDPEPLSGGAGEVPGVLQEIVHRCLEKRPEDRFSSAHDLALALQAAVSDVDAGLASAVVAAQPRGRWLVVAGVCAAALAIATAAVLLIRGRPVSTGTTLVPTRIAVAAFENHTGDSSLDPFGPMAADWIAQGLSQLTGVEVAPTSPTLQGAPRAAVSAGADPLRALAERTGAGTVISGSFYLVGQRLQLQAKLTDARLGTLIYAVEPVSGARDAPMEVLELLRQRIMGLVATRFGSPGQLSFSRKPPLFAAYREYLTGAELFGTDYGEAIRHFRKAAELDPDFMAPRLHMAPAYGNEGEYEKEDALLGQIAQNRERLTPQERCFLDFFVAGLAGHRSQQRIAMRQALKLVPDSFLVAKLAADSSLALNLPQEAVDTFPVLALGEAADGLGVRKYWWANTLAQAYHLLGSYERELEVGEQWIQTYPDTVGSRNAKVRALAALGRLDELGRVIDETLGMHGPGGSPADLMLLAGAELRAHGRHEDGLAMARRAVSWLESRPAAAKAKGSYRSDLADALYAAERWDEARAIYGELSARLPIARHAGERPEAWGAAGTVPEGLLELRAIDYLGALGALAARRGDAAEARRASDELAGIDRPYLFGANTFWRARIGALLGDRQGSVELLRESFAQGKAFDTAIHREPDFEPLHGYPPFEDLTRPQG